MTLMSMVGEMEKGSLAPWTGISHPQQTGLREDKADDSLCSLGDGKTSVTSVFEHRWPSGKAGEVDPNSSSHSSHWLSVANTRKFKLRSLPPGTDLPNLHLYFS